MDIKELRNRLNMSQREFSTLIGVPLGTLRNWEQNIAKAPDYVFDMIETGIRRDRMINVETIKFVKMLDDLAQKLKSGVIPFGEVTEESSSDALYYDETSPDNNGYYRVALDVMTIGGHHDIISFYDSDTYDYTVRLDLEYEDPCVVVRLVGSNELIVVDAGEWHFA